MPQEINILKSMVRNATFKSVNEMHRLSNTHKKMLLDFSNTRKIYSSGMLYFFAELDNILNIKRGLLSIRCKQSSNEKVNHVLEQIGLFRLCKHKFTARTSFDDVVHWRAHKGVRVISKGFDLVVSPEGELQRIGENMDIYGGCIEATKNAHQHAYIEQRKKPSKVDNAKTAWWIFSQVRDGYISIVICDLGIGIHNTLPKKEKSIWEYIKEHIRKLGISQRRLTDANIIRGAIDTPSSRTGLGYRGNGLKKIAKIANDDPRASFMICSGKGYVGKEMNRTISHNFKTELPGTIVSWKLPLEVQRGTRD